MSDNPKPSNNLKSILWIIIGATVSTLISFIIPQILKKKENKTISVQQLQGTNLLSDSLINNTLNREKYFLKDDSVSIHGYYRKTVILTNAGDEGVEELKINIKVLDTNIQFVNIPQIETSPKEIINAMQISLANENNHSSDILIPLLNSGESVILNFEAYSKIRKDSFDVAVAVRKKDWIMKEEKSFVKKDTSTPFSTSLMSDLPFLLLLVYFFWKRDSDRYKMQSLEHEIEMLKKESPFNRKFIKRD